MQAAKGKNGMDDSDKRHNIVARSRPPEWDNTPAALTDELREMLKNMVDTGTSIDSGCGNGHGDLWFTIGGIEFYLSVSRSERQIIEDTLGA